MFTLNAADLDMLVSHFEITNWDCYSTWWDDFPSFYDLPTVQQQGLQLIIKMVEQAPAESFKLLEESKHYRFTERLTSYIKRIYEQPYLWHQIISDNLYDL
ncbi:hypothetical protein P7D52_10370 [Enterococcus dongliensis]|uniref:hypothetical protein n=1 Tax=Enterococcus dongliensis TaxID=2559925 RepID=UPI00288F137C|nr:hypothetical protein [Enterococcus dongliensis]MDT2643190.1 hypothetical protein [Enterococcus dongliensis]